MINIEEYIGRKFNALTIIKEVEPRERINKQGHLVRIRRVECLCDCGKLHITDLYHLIKGMSISCGCFRINRMKANKKIIFGFGVNDYIGNIKDIEKTYKLWSSIIDRCYNNIMKNIGYKDCTVCEEWKNLTDFKRWFDEHYDPKTMQGWHLDKDILVKGNKVYSPSTCCFVPSEVNILFTKRQNKRGDCPIGVVYEKRINRFISSMTKNSEGCYIGCYKSAEEAFNAYKKAKESHIKAIADKWKDKIADNVYQALYNYQVEITD